MDTFRHFCMRFQFFQSIPETVRRQDSANSLYSCAPYPTQSLKNLHRRKGGGCLGSCIKIYRALGTLHPKRTFNRIAANDCSEPNFPLAASQLKSVFESGSFLLWLALAHFKPQLGSNFRRSIFQKADVSERRSANFFRKIHLLF